MISEIATMLSLTSIAISAYLLIDGYITNKRLKQNQKEWNEYSKDMSVDEMYAVFGNWIKQNQIKHGWKYMYIPSMFDIPERKEETQ